LVFSRNIKIATPFYIIIAVLGWRELPAESYRKQSAMSFTAVSSRIASPPPQSFLPPAIIKQRNKKAKQVAGYSNLFGLQFLLISRQTNSCWQILTLA
jgi:hypothetical protein